MPSDSQEMVRRFNEDEAIWRRYQAKRFQFLLRHVRGARIAEKLERLAWAEAEAKIRPTPCLGIDAP